MATLESRLNSLASLIGADVKALNTAKGDLSTLSTTAKGNLVAALNEVYTLANGAASGASITTAIDNLRNELRAGASAALDTFAEVAAQIATDESGAAALATAVGNRVRFDAVQTLTAPQSAQARSNISALSTIEIGNPDADFASTYTAAKV